MRQNRPFDLVMFASRIFSWQRLEKSDIAKQAAHAKRLIENHGRRIFKVREEETLLPIQKEAAYTAVKQIIEEMATDKFWRTMTSLSAVEKYIQQKAKESTPAAAVDVSEQIGRLLE